VGAFAFVFFNSISAVELVTAVEEIKENLE
jgi:hypothetical protein